MKKVGFCKSVRKINDNDYVIDLSKDLSISMTFNVADLSEFHPNVLLFPGSNSRSSFSQAGENDVAQVVEEFLECLDKSKSKRSRKRG